MSQVNHAGMHLFALYSLLLDETRLDFASIVPDQHYGCYGRRFPPTLAILMLTKLLLGELTLVITTSNNSV